MHSLGPVSVGAKSTNHPRLADRLAGSEEKDFRFSKDGRARRKVHVRSLGSQRAELSTHFRKGLLNTVRNSQKCWQRVRKDKPLIWKCVRLESFVYRRPWSNMMWLLQISPNNLLFVQQFSLETSIYYGCSCATSFYLIHSLQIKW